MVELFAKRVRRADHIALGACVRQVDRSRLRARRGSRGRAAREGTRSPGCSGLTLAGYTTTPACGPPQPAAATPVGRGRILHWLARACLAYRLQSTPSLMRRR